MILIFDRLLSTFEPDATWDRFNLTIGIVSAFEQVSMLCDAEELSSRTSHVSCSPQRWSCVWSYSAITCLAALQHWCHPHESLAFGRSRYEKVTRPKYCPIRCLSYLAI